ncbi:MAG: hypothetical protein PVF15_05985 [Candidatus Bathyarchaeota archaeon]|jgi:hypothetical protein
MKKKLWFGLVLSVLWIFTAVSPIAQACYKEAELISTGDGDMIIEVGEDVVWLFHISVSNWWGTNDFTDVVVTDKLGAELEIDSPFNMTHGTVEIRLTGKSEKVHLTWYVGTLSPGERAHLYFLVSTDINPGGKQEYTTPGWYELNSGPTAKYRVLGEQYSYEANTLGIWVEP